MYAGTRPADGHATLAQLCLLGATAPEIRCEDAGEDPVAIAAVHPATRQRLWRAAESLTRAQQRITDALASDDAQSQADAIAHTKAALAFLVATR